MARQQFNDNSSTEGPSSWMTLVWDNLTKTSQPNEHGQNTPVYRECRGGGCRVDQTIC